MSVSRVLPFLLLASCLEASAQFRGRANSDVQWNRLAILNGGTDIARIGKYCGIYRTASDRQSGNLSLAIDCKSEDHKIKPGFVRDKPAIKIVHRKKTERFLRQEIYGYRDCRGNEYHFFEGSTYELINPGEAIPIYRVYQLRGKQRQTQFFFGARTGSIKPLTLDQLSMEFSDEPAFLQRLQLLAENDFQLVKYRYLIDHVWRTAE